MRYTTIYISDYHAAAVEIDPPSRDVPSSNDDESVQQGTEDQLCRNAKSFYLVHRQSSRLSFLRIFQAKVASISKVAL